MLFVFPSSPSMAPKIIFTAGTSSAPTYISYYFSSQKQENNFNKHFTDYQLTQNYYMLMRAILRSLSSSNSMIEKTKEFYLQQDEMFPYLVKC